MTHLVVAPDGLDGPMRVARLTLGGLVIAAGLIFALVALLRREPDPASLTWHALDARFAGEVRRQLRGVSEPVLITEPALLGWGVVYSLMPDTAPDVVAATRLLAQQHVVLVHDVLGAQDLRGQIQGPVDVALIDRAIVSIRVPSGAEILPYARFVEARREQARRWLFYAVLAAAAGGLMLALPRRPRPPREPGG